VVTLLAHRIPFELEGVAAGEAPPRPSTWDRGPVLLMLVDPTPAEWPAPDAPPVPIVLVHCVEPGPAEMVAGIGRGVAAVVPAARIAEDLVAALTLAARGYLVVDGEDARSMFAALVSRRAPSGLPELTARESDILHSIALGHTVRQTARALGIAEKTVENTQARLFRKLGARNRTGALAAAHALGLVEAVESRTQVAPSAPSWALRAPLPSLAGDTDVGVGPA
jgi:DNA-binding CsgD family transcriptional regulator